MLLLQFGYQLATKTCHVAPGFLCWPLQWFNKSVGGMWGLLFAKTVYKHFHLQETKARGRLFHSQAKAQPEQRLTSLLQECSKCCCRAARGRIPGFLQYSRQAAGTRIYNVWCLVSWTYKRLSGLEQQNWIVSKWLIDWLNNSSVCSSIESPSAVGTLVMCTSLSKCQVRWGSVGSYSRVLSPRAWKIPEHNKKTSYWYTQRGRISKPVYWYWVKEVLDKGYIVHNSIYMKF